MDKTLNTTESNEILHRRLRGLVDNIDINLYHTSFIGRLLTLVPLEKNGISVFY